MIGVDIGGTNLLIGKIIDGKVVERVHQPIQARGDFNLVATQTCKAIKDFGCNDISSIGISVAGSVNVDKGIVLRAENLDWDDAPLAQFVSDELQCKVVIENDVTAAAWGEFSYGAGISSDSLFAVWIGTGIGGGLILNKTIWRGPLGTGGEFGMGISEYSPSEDTRVLEGFSSRSGLQRLLQMPDLDTTTIANGYGNSKQITQAVNTGAFRIGSSIANVITLLSLDTVVLGGGLVEALGEPYVEKIRQQFLDDVFPEHCKQCKFYITTLGPDAGLLGAASLANLAQSHPVL
ncbi:MAG: ROK family protein [Phycisphaerales bacterium]|nr:ROK family protein [Planctomycetota bacterium]MBL6997876.1 ROK family protein [Phycisphaerales bacterium]